VAAELAHETRDPRLLLREVNERIRSTNESFLVAADTYEVVCECARLDCLERLEVPVAAYEDVRLTFARFLVARGHEQAGIERIVGDRPTYSVVELA
jgi:hypothetical protein